MRQPDRAGLWFSLAVRTYVRESSIEDGVRGSCLKAIFGNRLMYDI